MSRFAVGDARCKRAITFDLKPPIGVELLFVPGSQQERGSYVLTEQTLTTRDEVENAVKALIGALSELRAAALKRLEEQQAGSN